MPGGAKGSDGLYEFVIGSILLALVVCGIGLWVAWPRLFPTR